MMNQSKLVITLVLWTASVARIQAIDYVPPKVDLPKTKITEKNAQTYINEFKNEVIPHLESLQKCSEKARLLILNYKDYKNLWLKKSDAQAALSAGISNDRNLNFELLKNARAVILAQQEAYKKEHPPSAGQD